MILQQKIMERSLQQPQNNPYVFIDTCVIHFAGDKNKSKSEAVIECLSTLTKEGYRLAISEITLYEKLHGLWGKRATKAASLLRVYEKKVVSNQVLTLASILGGLYHDEKLDGIDTGDKIIAATAILERGFVLTANHKDFPNPFFLTEKSFALSYKVKSYFQTLDLALYKPDFELIRRRVNEKDKQ